MSTMNARCMSLEEFYTVVYYVCVCAQERVKNIPEKYVLSRWKKSIKRKHADIKINYGVKKLKPQMVSFEKLCKHFDEVVEYATKAFHELLHQFISDLPNMDPIMDNVKRILYDNSIQNSAIPVVVY